MGDYYFFFWRLIISSIKISPENIYENVFIAFLCVFCVLVYEVGVIIWFATFFRDYQAQIYARPVNSWISEFLNLTKNDLSRSMIGVIAVTLLSLIISTSVPGGSGIVAFLAVILMYGIFWIYWAFKNAGYSWKIIDASERMRHSDAIVGFDVLNIFAWLLFFVIVDAGRKLLGG